MPEVGKAEEKKHSWSYRIVLSLAILFIVVVVGMFLGIGDYEYMCFQCGARWQYFIVRKETFESETERIKKVLGAHCPHNKWIFNCSNRGLHDAFAWENIPILQIYVLEGIERLPRPEWRREAALALGDYTNLSNWTGAMMLRLVPEADDPSVNWEEWWKENSIFFKKTTSTEEAREVLKKAIDIVGTNSWLYKDFQRHFPKEIVPENVKR